MRIYKKLILDQFFLKNGLAVTGNPHIVFFVKNLSKIDIGKVGPYIETHKLFPERVNVEICQVINDNKIKALIWERGAGNFSLWFRCMCSISCSLQAWIDKRKSRNSVRWRFFEYFLEY